MLQKYFWFFGVSKDINFRIPFWNYGTLSRPTATYSYFNDMNQLLRRGKHFDILSFCFTWVPMTNPEIEQLTVYVVYINHISNIKLSIYWIRIGRALQYASIIFHIWQKGVLAPSGSFWMIIIKRLLGCCWWNNDQLPFWRDFTMASDIWRFIRFGLRWNEISNSKIWYPVPVPLWISIVMAVTGFRSWRLCLKLYHFYYHIYPSHIVRFIKLCQVKHIC